MDNAPQPYAFSDLKSDLTEIQENLRRDLNLYLEKYKFNSESLFRDFRDEIMDVFSDST